MQTNLTDGDALLGGLEPPRFQLHGVRYTGQHLSLLQYLRAMTLIEARQTALSKGFVLGAESATRHLVDLIFPPPPRTYTRSWRSLWLKVPVPAAEPSVADLVLALPLPTQERVLVGFTRSLTAALRGTPDSEEETETDATAATSSL